MTSLIKGKGSGFYSLVLAGCLAVASFVYYMGWAQANFAVNTVIILGLVLGFAVNSLLLFYDNDYLVIAQTVLYSIALFQLLVDHVGSFVDAYQGIVMFGDPTQVDTILTISAFIAVCVVASVVAGFLRRAKA